MNMAEYSLGIMEGPTPPSEKIIEADPMDNEFQEKAWDAMVSFNETSEGDFYWMPVEIVSVSTLSQSIGKYYWIDVVLAESRSRKTEMSPEEFVEARLDSEINPNGSYVLNRLTIYSNLKTGDDKLFQPEVIKVLDSTEREAYQSRPTRAIEHDPTDDQFMEKAWESLRHFNQTSEGDFHWMPLKIRSVRSCGKWPHGDLVKMEVVLGESQKRKGEISSEDFADERAGMFRVGGRRALYRIPFFDLDFLKKTTYVAPLKVREIPPAEDD